MEAPLGVALSQSMDSVNTNNGEEEVKLKGFVKNTFKFELSCSILNQIKIVKLLNYGEITITTGNLLASWVVKWFSVLLVPLLGISV
ncbi:hypothetical protein GWI33_008646 [Rhynchophorus ferrugineus]|uniref:Uncharacterized protein n=1 Tax=Rhynchophorus ferrugineus TaxID=354439 RepID=A0A834ME21_RHYFE|nr:hypothetical protein GWI33_008646 [Rhynchophorus ferrugineus]